MMVYFVEGFINTLQHQITEIVRQAYIEGTIDVGEYPNSLPKNLYLKSDAKKAIDELFAFNRSKDRSTE